MAWREQCVHDNPANEYDSDSFEHDEEEKKKRTPDRNKPETEQRHQRE